MDLICLYYYSCLISWVFGSFYNYHANLVIFAKIKFYSHNYKKLIYLYNFLFIYK